MYHFISASYHTWIKSSDIDQLCHKINKHGGDKLSLDSKISDVFILVESTVGNNST